MTTSPALAEGRQEVTGFNLTTPEQHNAPPSNPSTYEQRTPSPSGHLEHQQNIPRRSSPAELPLTPPSSNGTFKAVNRIIAAFKDLQSGKSPREVEFLIEWEDYCELQDQLELDKELSDYVRCKLRYDYDPKDKRLLLRMPTRVHELVLDRLDKEIERQIGQIRAGSGEAAILAAKIYCGRSSTFKLPSSDKKQSKNDPDASWYHARLRDHPVVVLEVSYSQRTENVHKRASRYIRDSRAGVRAVVVIDIDYNAEEEHTARNATYSVYRPELQDNKLRAVPYPNQKVFYKERQVIEDCPDLCLYIKDFGYGELIQKINGEDNTELHISAQVLAGFLDQETAPQDEEPLSEPAVPLNTITDRTPSPSVDELDSENERQWTQKEEETEQTAFDNDPAFKKQSKVQPSTQERDTRTTRKRARKDDDPEERSVKR